jgi:hypothetical protein
MSPNIKIDFHGGTHGHFLEYVVNTYVFKCPQSIDSIYSDRGSIKEIDRPGRRVVCGHFSNNAQGRDADPKYIGFEFTPNDKIIRIAVNQEEDSFFIAFTNLIYRSSGATFEQHMDNIPEEIRSNQALLRNDFYSKINERQRYADLFPKFSYVWNENFEFPFMHFYDFAKFCETLTKLSTWLGEKFVPNTDLYDLWLQFISKNQGLNSYNQCKEIVESILGNQEKRIACTTLEEAWIIYKITKITGVYLNIDSDFPKSTQQIYEMLK